MGRFHQGSSSQSRKINCKWESKPFNGAAACILFHVQVVPVMLSSTRALVTALLLVRAKRYQDQTRQTDYLPLQRLIIQHTRLCGYSTSHPLCVRQIPHHAPRTLLVQSSCFGPARARRMPSSERAREPDASSHRIFLALRIAVLSAVWPLLLLAMGCIPPSPRDCCKPRRFSSSHCIIVAPVCVAQRPIARPSHSSSSSSSSCY